MHIRRRISYREEASKHFSDEPVLFWLRSRKWASWVANELDAFAVLARQQPRDVRFEGFVSVLHSMQLP